DPHAGLECLCSDRQTFQTRSGHTLACQHGWCDLGSWMCSTAPTRLEGRKPPPKPARVRADPSFAADPPWTNPAPLH
uniref:Uncharacterized protein n=1 Tax=Bubo bubo TaxID=30461 RepID=A0A8C0F8P1_BUBBB